MTGTPSVLGVGDELVARKRLGRLLSAIDGIALAGECESAEQALRRIREGGIDVVLLDIQMPGLSGVEALQLLGDAAPCVIFCTAHADFAVDAFAGGAVDYLLKPIEAGRLAKALERTRPRVPAGSSRLALTTPRGIVLLAPAEISHAVLENEVVTVFTKDGAQHFVDATLQDLENRLPTSFFRAHRRVLLNLDLVARLETVDSGGFRAQMANGQGVTVSRQSARELRRALGLSRPVEDVEP